VAAQPPRVDYGLDAPGVVVGSAVGLDLWRTKDQAGNDPAAAIANAQAEGVAERVELRDGDARRLPFDGQSFDVVVSSMALHNIPGASGRAVAVGEMVRVLRPGGRVAILDFRHTGQYAAVLAAAGLGEVHRSRRRLGMYPPVRVVTATKP
jgi:arsenite methyltransferase